MKFEAMEILAIAIVLLLPLGIGQFVEKTTLPEYGAAVQIRGVLLGTGAENECWGEAECIPKPPAPHIAVAAGLEKIYASIAGLGAASLQAIVGFLLIFPPMLLALVSVMLYLACRQMGYGKSQSAFATLLFSTSLVAVLPFLPGMFGSSQLAAFFFAGFLLFFAMYVHKPDRVAVILPAAILGICTGYINAAFALAGIAVAASFAFAHHKKAAKNYLPLLAAMALVLAVAGFLSQDKAQLVFVMQGLEQIATMAPFLFAAASICIGLFFIVTKDAEFFALFIFGALLFCANPLAGAMLLVLPAVEGVARATGENSNSARLAASFACGFFLVLGITYSLTGAYGALAAGVMLGLLFPLVLHFYEYNARAFFSVVGAGLVMLSVFFAAFVQLPPMEPHYPNYTDDGLSGALAYLAGAGADRIASLEREDALGFYLPNAASEPQADVEEYLLSGNASIGPGAYLLLSMPALEMISQKGGFEVYYYAQNYTNSGVTFALFVSKNGRLLARELSGGNFALKDGAALDSSGRYYAPIALPRMVMLSGEKPLGSHSGALLLMEEGMAPPKAAAIYAGQMPGTAFVKGFGRVEIYRVG
jgi:hypothetical protein